MERIKIKMIAYPYRMFLIEALKTHGIDGLVERLNEALLIADGIVYSNEETEEIKKLIFQTAVEMLNNFYATRG